MKFEEKTFSELNKEAQFKRAYKKIFNIELSNPNFSGRTIMEDQYGFTIDSSVVKEFSSGFYNTYTFFISRDSINDDYLENLVIKVDSSNTVSAVIIKYLLNSPYILHEEHHSFYLDTEKIEITSINFNDDQSKQTAVGNCIGVWMCPFEGWHQATNKCVEEKRGDLQLDTSMCDDGSGFSNGSFPNYNGYPSSGGGGNSGGGGDPPPNDYDGSDPDIHGNGGNIITSPNTGCRGAGCIEIEFEDPDEEDGCSKIENLLNETNYPDLKDKLISLMGKTNLTEERGKFRTENATVNQNMPVGSDGSVEFDPLPSPYIFMAHTHNSPSNETYSVFSWEDLRAIYTLIKGNHIDNSQFVFFLFTADGTRLALTIDDPIKYRKFFGFNDDPLFELETGIKRNKAKLELFYAKDDEEPRIKEDNTDNDEDLKNILDLFQDNDLGVSLFSCNQDLTEFTELTHNTNTDDIDEDACE